MKRLFLPVLLGSLGACQATPPEQPAAAATRPAPARHPVAPLPPPAAVAVRFFNWYKTYPANAEFLEVKALHPPDTTRFVVVNEQQANHYLATLRSSGCLSDRFLARMRRRVWEQGDTLHPHDPGDAVFEFDADPILDSQDGDPYLTQIEQAAKTVRYLAPGRAIVTASYASCPVKYPDKLFYVRRYASGWLIDSIGTVYDNNVVQEAPADE